MFAGRRKQSLALKSASNWGVELVQSLSLIRYWLNSSKINIGRAMKVACWMKATS